MSSAMATTVSEWWIKPLTSPHPNHHFTPWELLLLNANYSQKGLLFPKPTSDDGDFSITAFLDDLRRSLSATLTHFPVLAARLATRTHPSYVVYLDPADDSPGVKFVYATADAAMSDVLTPLDVPPLVHSFFDLNHAINHDGHTLPLLSIQVTELVDGIFIGGSVNHIVADGTSFWHFMEMWSEVFKSKKENSNFTISHPTIRTPWIHDRSDPIISLPYTHHDQFVKRHKFPHFKERFFHFSRASLSKLKAKANIECNTDKISSLQAVAAFMWRSVTRVQHLSLEHKTTCRLVVNNRPRLSPPLPDDYFGNLVQTVRGTTTVGDLLANGLGWAALRVHEAIKEHDHRAVKEWGESWVRDPMIATLSELLDLKGIHIGSSPRFNMYGCEFGLGKAVAARSGCTNKASGKLTMFPGPEGDGSMDLEVCLLPEQMEEITYDEELAFALTIK